MLAIAGGKGGCGKTTTALGLARTLARRGHDPLVVDADCDMPDLHHAAGIERDDGVDALARGAPLSRVCRYPDAVPGVALVTAGRPERTAPALRAVRGWEGPVLVDCPAGIGPDATRPLRHARATLVVSTARPQCLDDTRRTLTAARQLDAPPVGVLVRTVAGRSARAPGSVAGCPVLAAVTTVEEPLSAPLLSRAWSTVADRLLAVEDTDPQPRAERSVPPDSAPADHRERRRAGSDRSGTAAGRQHRVAGERRGARF